MQGLTPTEPFSLKKKPT